MRLVSVSRYEPLKLLVKQMKADSIVDLITAQAEELLKSDIVKKMLDNCTTEEEKLMKLAVASVYSLVKANK